MLGLKTIVKVYGTQQMNSRRYQIKNLTFTVITTTIKVAIWDQVDRTIKTSSFHPNLVKILCLRTSQIHPHSMVHNKNNDFRTNPIIHVNMMILQSREVSLCQIEARENLTTGCKKGCQSNSITIHKISFLTTKCYRAHSQDLTGAWICHFNKNKPQPTYRLKIQTMPAISIGFWKLSHQK